MQHALAQTMDLFAKAASAAEDASLTQPLLQLRRVRAASVGETLLLLLERSSSKTTASAAADSDAFTRWLRAYESRGDVAAAVAYYVEAAAEAVAEGRQQEESERCNMPAVSLENAPSFEDVVGMDDTKTALLRALVLPLQFPNLASRPRALLLRGSPGTGKTFIVKAAVTELQLQLGGGGRVVFFAPNPSELRSKWFGGSERAIDSLFDCAAQRAKECGPNACTVIFIDEIDSFVRKRFGTGADPINARVLNALLARMDGFSSSDRVVLIGATNAPLDEMDDAFRSRVSTVITVHRPSPLAIADMIKYGLASRATALLPKEYEVQDARSARDTRCGGEPTPSGIPRQQLWRLVHSFFDVDEATIMRVAQAMAEPPKRAGMSAASARDVSDYVTRVWTLAGDAAYQKNEFSAVKHKGAIRAYVPYVRGRSASASDRFLLRAPQWAALTLGSTRFVNVQLRSDVAPTSLPQHADAAYASADGSHYALIIRLTAPSQPLDAVALTRKIPTTTAAITVTDVASLWIPSDSAATTDAATTGRATATGYETNGWVQRVLQTGILAPPAATETPKKVGVEALSKERFDASHYQPRLVPSDDASRVLPTTLINKGVMSEALKKI